MTASVNVIAVLHQYESYNGISSYFFCFSSYAILRTSAEGIAAKRQNLPTKEKPESAYYADLHEFEKRILSLKVPND